jgi:hypothetical protein
VANYVTNQDWREVFLLTVSMLQSADDLLLMIKAKIDELLSHDTELQQFLIWLNERAIIAINSGCHYKPAITKAYHSFLIFNSVDIKANALAIASALNSTSEVDNSAMDITNTSESEKSISSAISSASDNERAIAIAIVISSSIENALETVIYRTMAVSSAIDKAIILTSDPELEGSLKDLKAQLPEAKNISILRQWWKDHGFTWTNQLRDAQMRYRYLVHNWQFSELQVALLAQYYRANLLLVECLISDCSISPSVRDEIEATLLLSIKDIEQYKKIQQQSE